MDNTIPIVDSDEIKVLRELAKLQQLMVGFDPYLRSLEARLIVVEQQCVNLSMAQAQKQSFVEPETPGVLDVCGKCKQPLEGKICTNNACDWSPNNCSCELCQAKATSAGS